MDLDRIPEGWELTNTESTCEILDHKRIPLNSDERYNIKGNIPYYGANGVIDYINNHIFDEDLILMAEDGGYFDEYETKSVAYRIFGKSWINNHAHVLRVKASYDFDYIFYSLQHKNVIPFIKGGTRSKLNQAELREITIFVPKSSKEQRKIASILQGIDNTINKTKELIEKYEMIKRGLMQDLFAENINHGGKIKENDEFEFVRIGSLALVTDIDHKMPPSVGHGIPFISAKDITEDGEITFDGAKQISEESFSRLSRKICPRNGDIIFSRIGTIGRVGLVKSDRKFLMSYSCCIIRIVNSEVDSTYLSYVLKSEMINKQILLETQSIGVPDLGLEKICEFEIKIPKEKKEQKRIAEILLLVDEKIKSEKAYLNKLTKIKAGLMQDLLTGKVRVKVEECQENSHT